MEIKTLNDIYAVTCTLDRSPALKYKRDGKWVDISVAEFCDSVKFFAAGLRLLGVKPGDRVAILSENRPEWAIADFAILCNAAVTVPIYPTLLGWQIEYILNDSGSVAVICSTSEQLEKINGVRQHTPHLHNVIVCEGGGSGALTFQQVLDNGKQNFDARRFDELRTRPRVDDLATIVYTSGTTGNPKGAMLTHGNIASNVASVHSVMPIGRGMTAISILPLSHIFERMADYFYFSKGLTIAYAENVGKVGENLQDIKPDAFAAVPRLFEKMRERIMNQVGEKPAIEQKIFRWALGVAQQRLPYRLEHKPMPFGLNIKSKIADKLVFRKIIERLGGNVKYVFSGGAPLSPELAAFFIGAGLEILEGYGLTETSPVITANTPEARKVGTVGKMIKGVEVKIAPDGEILSRGPHIMKGYWNNPEATAQAIDPDGWFHTGDIGEIDSEGFLKITDRKKDIIINAYGKNIAPQPLEALLKSSPLIGTPVLIGDRRKYLSALIVPNFEKLERDAAAMGIRFDSREQLVRDDRIKQMYQEELDRFNRNLDRQEKIRRFALLPRDFTIENDEITPSLKVKRKNIDKKYKEVIDELYADENADEEREVKRA
ncbi:MAG TPA: long-chain fatty acid--CoA ligase [Thermoanaerobaculia bacterium]